MEVEKIISTILSKVGNTDVSPQTIKMLISLKPLAEGQEPDDKYFEEMANAVKSVQGNVNKVFSAKLAEQVTSKIEEYKASHQSDERSAKKEDDESDKRFKKLEDELSELRAERQREKAEQDRKDLLASVKRGLEAKFDKAGDKANAFFVKTALAKLEIPETGADIKALTDEAERLYNADVKEAGIAIDAPHSGGNAGSSKDKIDEHEFDDVAKIVGRDRPQTER